MLKRYSQWEIKSLHANYQYISHKKKAAYDCSPSEKSVMLMSAVPSRSAVSSSVMTVSVTSSIFLNVA